MRLRAGNEIALRRLELLQCEEPGVPNVLLFQGNSYPFSETAGRAGLVASFGGMDATITKSVVIRGEVFAPDAVTPSPGHLLSIPHLDDQEFRVVTATWSADRSHLTLEMGDPLDQ